MFIMSQYWLSCSIEHRAQVLKQLLMSLINDYFETFLGGGSIYYRLIKNIRNQSFRSFLSDTNCELINSNNQDIL